VPPGSYTFSVIADNGEGVWNTEGASLPLVVVPPFWRSTWFVTLTLAAAVGLATLGYRRRVGGLERARAAQAAFARQLIESQENERQRIAAELHDSLGQNLLIIKSRAVLGSAANQNPDAAREQFEEIAASAVESIEEVRQIAYNLRPYHLDRLGLANSIEDMIERIGASSAIRFETAIAELDGAIPRELEITLYRIVQEGVNNIVKHSQAARAWVAVARDGHDVKVTIRDDGRGFQSGAGVGLSSPARGFGLTGIAERVRMLGGHHTVSSSPGQGTTIEIRLQLQKRATGEDDNAR
jgi:signal transduction histidine kinase